MVHQLNYIKKKNTDADTHVKKELAKSERSLKTTESSQKNEIKLCRRSSTLIYYMKKKYYKPD